MNCGSRPDHKRDITQFTPVGKKCHRTSSDLGASGERSPRPNDTLTGATTARGVWLASNVSDMKMQAVTAAASGVWIGAGVNAALLGERRDGLREAH